MLIKIEFLGSDDSGKIVVNAIRTNILDAVSDPSFVEGAL